MCSLAYSVVDGAVAVFLLGQQRCRQHSQVKKRCLESQEFAGEEDEQEGDGGDSWLTRYVCCDQNALNILYKNFQSAKVLRIVRASDQDKPPAKQLLKFMSDSVARVCHQLINDREPDGDRKRVQPLMTHSEFVKWWEERVTEAGNKRPTVKVIQGMKNLAKQRIEADRARTAEIMASLEDFEPIKDITPEHIDKMIKIETDEDAASVLNATMKLLQDKGTGMRHPPLLLHHLAHAANCVFLGNWSALRSWKSTDVIHSTCTSSPTPRGSGSQMAALEKRGRICVVRAEHKRLKFREECGHAV
jgi:hypothetical protein